MLYQLSYAPPWPQCTAGFPGARPGHGRRMSENESPATDEPPADDSDEVLRKEQEGKGYGSTYGDDEGDAAPGLTEE
jgi:hypothetical protein